LDGNKGMADGLLGFQENVHALSQLRN